MFIPCPNNPSHPLRFLLDPCPNNFMQCSFCAKRLAREVFLVCETCDFAVCNGLCHDMYYVISWWRTIDREQAVQHREQAVQHREPTMQHREPTMQHREPTMQHREPTMQHREPTMQPCETTVQHDPATMLQFVWQRFGRPGIRFLGQYASRFLGDALEHAKGRGDWADLDEVSAWGFVSLCYGNAGVDFVRGYHAKHNEDFSFGRYRALQMACAYNKVDVVKWMVRDCGVDPSVTNSCALVAAANGGFLELVDMLLADNRVDPSSDHNAALRYAAERGRVGVVARLLADSRVDASAMDDYAVRFASTNGHTEVVRLLLAQPNVDPAAGKNYAIRYAAEYGHRDTVELLMQDGRVDAGADKLFAFVAAGKHGDLGMVEVMRMGCALSNARTMEAVWTGAITAGHLGVVQKLARELDLAELAKVSLELACESGELEILRYLRGDERVQQGMAAQGLSLGDLMRKGVRHGFTSVAKALFPEARGTLGLGEMSYFAESAVEAEDVELFQLVVAERSLDAASGEELLQEIAHTQNERLLQVILDDPCVDECLEEGAGLLYVVEAWWREGVAMMLGDARVNPDGIDHEAFRMACQNGMMDIIEVFLVDGRIDPFVDHFHLLGEALIRMFPICKASEDELILPPGQVPGDLAGMYTQDGVHLCLVEDDPRGRMWRSIRDSSDKIWKLLFHKHLERLWGALVELREHVAEPHVVDGMASRFLRGHSLPGTLHGVVVLREMMCDDLVREVHEFCDW